MNEFRHGLLADLGDKVQKLTMENRHEGRWPIRTKAGRRLRQLPAPWSGHLVFAYFLGQDGARWRWIGAAAAAADPFYYRAKLATARFYFQAPCCRRPLTISAAARLRAPKNLMELEADLF